MIPAQIYTSRFFRGYAYRLLAFFVICLGVLLFAPSAFAHTIRTDGTVTGLLHAEPDDSAIAGKSGNLLFFLEDTSGRLSAENCNCMVTISDGDKELLNQEIFLFAAGQSVTATIPFTFPSKGVYKVEVIGKPKKSGSFPPFHLTYDTRVEREASPPSETPSLDTHRSSNIYFLCGVVGVAVFLLGIVASRILPYKKHTKQKMRRKK